MKCQYCGSEISGQTKFCQYCGGRLEQAAPPTPPPQPSQIQQPSVPAQSAAVQPKSNKGAIVVASVILGTVLIGLAAVLAILLLTGPLAGKLPTANTPDSIGSGSWNIPDNDYEPVDTTDYGAYVGLEWLDTSSVNAAAVYDLGGCLLQVEDASDSVISYRLKEVTDDGDTVTEIHGTCEMAFGTGSCTYTDATGRQSGTLEFVFAGEKGITVTDSRNGQAAISYQLYAAGSPMGYTGYLEHRQRVLVHTRGSSAQISFEQWKDGSWAVQHVASGTVGTNGITPPEWRQEGSKTTPEGTFDLGFAFALDYLSTKLDFRQVTSSSRWVDDTDSYYYNTWQERSANGDWDHSESLYNTFHNGKARSSIVIEFNGDGISTSGVINGRGSAIFFSGRSGTLSGTNGDVFISQADMLQILPYLDKAENPVIQIHAQ